MELFWLIVIAAVVIGYFAFRRKEPSGLVSTGQVSRSGQPWGTATVERRSPSAEWESSETDAGRAIVLSSDVTLTLAGPPDAAHEVEDYLRDSADERYPERATQLAMLMSRLHVECLEVEAWRKKVVSAVQRRAVAVVEKKSGRPGLEKDDPDLFEELLEEAEHETFDELDERPSRWRSFDELKLDRPERLSDDDAFLEYVGHDAQALTALTQTWVRPGSAIRLRDRGFIEWTRLVDLGLALRGTDIPIEALANAYTMRELNDCLRPEKPFRRKKDVIPALTPAATAKLPEITKVFYLKPMPAEVEKGEQAFGWSLTHAKLILDTVRTYEAVRRSLMRSEKGSEFQVVGDCCKKATAASDREPSTRRPAKLPPFHVSCEAELEVY